MRFQNAPNTALLTNLSSIAIKINKQKLKKYHSINEETELALNCLTNEFPYILRRRTIFYNAYFEALSNIKMLVVPVPIKKKLTASEVLKEKYSKVIPSRAHWEQNYQIDQLNVKQTLICYKRYPEKNTVDSTEKLDIDQTLKLQPLKTMLISLKGQPHTKYLPSSYILNEPKIYDCKHKNNFPSQEIADGEVEHIFEMEKESYKYFEDEVREKRTRVMVECHRR